MKWPRNFHKKAIFILLLIPSGVELYELNLVILFTSMFCPMCAMCALFLYELLNTIL